MPHDKLKFREITLRIPRGGFVEQELLADADRLGMKQLPTLAVMRLSEFYELRKSGMVVREVPPQREDHGGGDPMLENAKEAIDAWP